MNQYEDTTRYTAPPDALGEPRRYNAEQIAEYAKSAVPCANQTYSVDAVADLLRQAADDVENEDFGIDAVI
jgi:hypothetical protein